MRVNGNKILGLTVLLTALSGTAALPVRGEDVAGAIDRDVNAALATSEVNGKADTDAACAKTESETGSAIDCAFNAELRGRSVSIQ